jgi:perosamine synthetase
MESDSREGLGQDVSQAEEPVLSYGKQTLDETDRRAVLQILEGDWLTQGPTVERFEDALCGYFGTARGVACSSGTAALHLAAQAMGWGRDDVILVPAMTFLATANCCVSVGAEPFFVDIDEDTLTIDPNEVERRVKELRAKGKRVRGVVGVDMAGHPCDWVALRALADRYDLDLLDDACHAMGGTYAGGTKVGSCEHADATTLSFHPVKHITSGEGGAVLTNDPSLADRVGMLRNHGVVRGEGVVPDWEGPWHSDMVELGFNYRLTDLQCALGLAQLPRLDGFVQRRREIAAMYGHLFAPFDSIRCPTERPGTTHAYHLYMVRIPFADSGTSRREVFSRCLSGGIQLQVHYRPVIDNSFYATREYTSYARDALPATRRFYEQAVSLPMYPLLRDEDLERVVRVVAGALGETGKAPSP